MVSALDLGMETLQKIENQFGPSARKRILSLKQLIDSESSKADLEKLQKVNNFFNRNAAFKDDQALWNKADYWATPVEFLLRGAGDCEDYSIAKYFSLIEMGIDESKLRITYVTAITINQAHMVLTYYETPQSEPLVLDNLIQQIKPASQRKDLIPIYSFNGSNLWLAKAKASGHPSGSASQLSLWQDLKRRATEDCETGCF